MTSFSTHEYFKTVRIHTKMYAITIKSTTTTTTIIIKTIIKQLSYIHEGEM